MLKLKTPRDIKGLERDGVTSSIFKLDIDL